MKKAKEEVMKIKVGLLIVCALVLGTILLARNNTVWADTTSDSVSPETQAQVDPSLQQRKKKGTVKPPSGSIRFCSDGDYAVGGIVTLHVEDLKEGYCIVLEIRGHGFLRRLPRRSGRFLTDLFIQRIYYRGRLRYKLPPSDGQIQTCFAVPPGKEDVTIYFFDFFGPRFDKRTHRTTWEPIDTTITDDGLACAFTDTSGIYALVGK